MFSVFCLSSSHFNNSAPSIHVVLEDITLRCKTLTYFVIHCATIDTYDIVLLLTHDIVLPLTHDIVLMLTHTTLCYRWHIRHCSTVDIWHCATIDTYDTVQPLTIWYCATIDVPVYDIVLLLMYQYMTLCYRWCIRLNLMTEAWLAPCHFQLLPMIKKSRTRYAVPCYYLCCNKANPCDL